MTKKPSKKASKKRVKGRPPFGDSPITIGGGGGIVLDKVKVKFERGKFNYSAEGSLELINPDQTISMIKIESGDLDVELPISDKVEIRVYYE